MTEQEIRLKLQLLVEKIDIYRDRLDSDSYPKDVYGNRLAYAHALFIGLQEHIGSLQDEINDKAEPNPDIMGPDK